MERATALTRSSTRTTELVDFLRRELAPTPERWQCDAASDPRLRGGDDPGHGVQVA